VVFSISKCSSDIYIEESFYTDKMNAIMASTDGIIDDLDDRNMVKTLAGSAKSYVGVGNLLPAKTTITRWVSKRVCRRM
jgi:hypothetical protein